MKGAARPWAAVAKPGSHGTERGGKGLPATTGGMRPSKSSTSLAFESRLSKLKRASSEDMLSKPGVVTPSGGSRLKKTITAGAISELAENRLRPSTGPPLSAKRTGIPAPRELPGAVAREKAVLRTRKAQPSPTSSGAPTPTKHSRPSLKPKNEAEVGDKAGLASQVKGLLAEAKTKDSEIVKLRHELKKHQDLSGLVDLPVDGLPAEVKSLIQDLQEKNKTFQRELLSLGEENRLLKEKLSQQEHSPLSDTSSSLPTPTTQESSFGSPTQPSLGSHPTGGSPCLNGPPLRNSGSSSSDVTKASLSPDASDFEHIVDVPSRPPSTGSNVFKSSRCSTSGSSPNNVSDLSVASLTERIQRMEENHHCTAEELQATLQELSDQQQVVQELTAENEKLAEEKAMLERSFCQHRERAEQLSQENEKLSALLQDRQKTDESKGKVHELELRCAELQEKAQFEREKMLNIQQQLTSSLRGLEREHHEAQGALKSLGEEAKRLGGLLETERQNNATLARTLEECKVHLEGLKIESQSLRSQLDSEKRKAAAMDAMEQAAGRSDAHELLRGIRAERDQLERSCTELRQELLKAQSEVKTLQGQLAKVEQEGVQLQARCAGQAEELSQTGQELEERRSEGEAELRSLKEALFQLEDQVEQQRVVRLHDQQIIGQMEDNLLKLEDQKLELERQLKMLNKQIKEDTEEWRRFQADLQTAVVVANDIKCEVQQELRAVKRRLLEEEEKTARLQKELEEVEGGSRLTPDSVTCTETEAANHWPGVPVSRLSPTPPESLATVKSLIKSFDLGCSGSTGQSVPIHKVCRSPLSNIPTRTAPAAAVSPIQRHSTFTNPKLVGKTLSKHTDLLELPLGDLLKGRNEEMKPDPFLRKSPSLESLSKPPTMTFGGRMFTSTPSGLKPPSKLSVERKDPLAALAREYGGSKRNALLKWCQKKTEGYPVRLVHQLRPYLDRESLLTVAHALITSRLDYCNALYMGLPLKNVRRLQNIDITNFSSSWSDGLAFCALLHTYLPAHIPYQELNSQDKKRNLLLAFQAAESVGIKPSLELSEIMYTDRPDWQSVMQYVAQIYKYFET